VTNAIFYGRNGTSAMTGLKEVLTDTLFLRERRGRISPEPVDVDVLIRWAWGKEYPCNAAVIYQRKGIGLASNKLAARRHLASVGIPVPELITSTPTKFPVVIRPPVHQAGSGFTLCSNIKEFIAALPKYQNGFYVSVFYPKEHEYRVHVAHGKVLFVQEKLAREERFKQAAVWNHHFGEFAFQVLKQSEWPIMAIQVAVEAVESMGLDYGAVDVMANPSSPEDFPPAVVCEVNTSPSLEGYSIGKYAEYFNWLFASPREHLVSSGDNYKGWRWSNA
jgi:glutathione synthase/RimK-type ligase-like ATP-grasp enzyme